MVHAVYITGSGSFFPGPPISNDDMELYLGQLGKAPSRVRARILRQNGINTRHYALNQHQESTHSNTQLAAEAVRAALQRSARQSGEMDFLVTATSQPDLPLPGFASMVHGEVGEAPCEVASIHGVCASSLSALKIGAYAIAQGEHDVAVVVASELASRLFKAQRFARQGALARGESLPFDTEFLRWMLSDGAGALVLTAKPDPARCCLRVEWVHSVSYAHEYEPCMYVGEPKDASGKVPRSWLDFPDFQAAADAGAINLRQDTRMLRQLVQCGVRGFFHLIESGKLDRNDIDWFVCHYSSHVFRGEVRELLERGGLHIPEARWYTNLYSRGNVGAASALTMIDELIQSEKLFNGQRIVVCVPESGRFTFAYALLTVVSTGKPSEQKSVPVDLFHTSPPALATSGKRLEEQLVRQLTEVWCEFEEWLRQVPILRRLQQGTFTVDDYRHLLFHMRQQVIDGSRWISRVASNITSEFFPIRSAFINHSRDEHRDYEMIEHDFVAVGGTLETILAGEKNIGSEALSGYILSRASRENPFDLIGAMFIIEGLGQRVARRWGEAIREQLQLPPEHVSFLLYHSESDVLHFQRLDATVQSGVLTEGLVKDIVKAARVTARLYALQLESITEAT